MPALPADLGGMLAAIQAWLEAELAGWTVIRAEQDAPAPAYPYASWKLTSPVRIGRSSVQTIETAADEAMERLEHDEELTLTIQLMDRANAMGAALGLEASAFRSTVRDALWAAGLVIVDRLSITDLSQIAGSLYESRWVLDLRARARSRIEQADVDWIDSLAPAAVVSIDGDVTGTLEN